MVLVLFTTLGLNLLLMTGCAQKGSRSEDNLTRSEKTPPPTIRGTRYTTLIFPKGKSQLGQKNKAELKTFAQQIHQKDKRIEEIRVLAWGDVEYPDKVKGNTSPKEVGLASERAQNIKAYLEDDLKENSDIDAYNMARRPDLLSKVLRDDEYDVKEAFENSGTTSSELPNGTLSYTKASKALVIIDYEGDEDNLKR